ncbi:MAG TPA: hypothetical protein VN281_04840 [Verrucomicrobiae bacterium]|jgi:hypothetical protein|nr:hypothetical protein [Verrucomicrobiae bacterium]
MRSEPHKIALAERVRLTLVKGGAVCFTFALLSGCSPNPPTPKDAVPAAWSWTAYPAVEKMRLATLPCQVIPKTSLTIQSPISGQLRLYIEQPETNLPAGFVWAEFEPKALKLEAEELVEARQRIDERERLFKEIDLPKEKIKLNRDVSELKREVALLELLSTNRDLARVALNSAGLSREGLLKHGTLEQSKDELALLEQNLGWLSPTNPAVLGIDLQSARMELDRRQLDFDRRQAQARFSLPFAGELITSIQLAQGVKEYPVSAGEELAVVRDLSSIRLRVPLEEVAWAALPPEKLTAALTLPDGTRLEAAFVQKKLEHAAMREVVCYYFQFPPGDTTAASHLVGTDISCDLWISLSQPACVVPKLALVLREPAAFQNRNWNEGLAKVLPGAQLMLEGQTDLAILRPVQQIKPANSDQETSSAKRP